MVVDLPVLTVTALSDDYVFFNEGEIAWNGESHYFTGIQVNSSKMDEFERIVCCDFDFASIDEFIGYFQNFLMAVEVDSEIRVPRSMIAPGIRKALPEGSLTGITLANLAACDSAIVLNKLESFEAYTVLYDPRLEWGIPQFFNLVARMVWDLRQCVKSQVGKPFTIRFHSGLNVGDDYFGEVEKPVAGVQRSSREMEVCCAPEINLGAGDSATFPSSGPEVSVSAVEEFAEKGSSDVLSVEDAASAHASDGETADRDATLAACNVAISAQEAFGKSVIPHDIIDEVERAESGDLSIDVDDLLRRLCDALPHRNPSDLSNITFDDGNIATGRRFKIAYPDGWTVIDNYEESYLLVKQERPFVIVRGEASADDDLSRYDRIIYSAIDGDHEINGVYKQCGFDDFHWAIRWVNIHDRSNKEGILGMKPPIVWDEEIQAVNTKCLVAQRQIDEASNRLEFYIYPYAADHYDSLRFVFAYEDGMDIEAPRNMVLKIAASVELDNPYVPDCLKTLEKAVSKKVPADDFISMVNCLGYPYVAFGQQIFDAALCKYYTVADKPSEDESVLFSEEVVVSFKNKAIPRFEKLMDAYDTQVALWHTDAELDKFLYLIEGFNRSALPNIDQPDPGIRRVLYRANSDLYDEPAELRLPRERLEYARQHRGEPSSNVKYQKVASIIAAAGAQEVASVIAAAGAQRVAYAIAAVSRQKDALAAAQAKQIYGEARRAANEAKRELGDAEKALEKHKNLQLRYRDKCRQLNGLEADVEKVCADASKYADELALHEKTIDDLNAEIPRLEDEYALLVRKLRQTSLFSFKERAALKSKQERLLSKIGEDKQKLEKAQEERSESASRRKESCVWLIVSKKKLDSMKQEISRMEEAFNGDDIAEEERLRNRLYEAQAAYERMKAECDEAYRLYTNA